MFFPQRQENFSKRKDLSDRVVIFKNVMDFLIGIILVK